MSTMNSDRLTRISVLVSKAVRIVNIPDLNIPDCGDCRSF